MTRKNLLLTILLALSLLSALFGGARPAAAQTAPADDADLPLCLPDSYPTTPADCLALGPSPYLTELARKGIDYPFRPLPAYRPDPAMGYSDINYLKVGETALPLYASLEDAMSGSAVQSLGSGLKYLAVGGRVDNDGGAFYPTTSGLWVAARDTEAACCIRSGRIWGLVFASNPASSFGWIVDQAELHAAPGYAAPKLPTSLYRETVVQIYDKVSADGTDWYMLGMNTWVERRYIRQFVVNLTPPQGVENGRWIEINLYEQTLGVYENGRLVYATLIASGAEPYYTRPGLFQIYEKLDKTTMSGAFEADRSDFYYLEEVPYTMYYDEARALHGAYWRTLYGYPQSHGCVNLSIGDARWLYEWAQVGDWVYVWDPSGETPTDPALYTEGGA